MTESLVEMTDSGSRKRNLCIETNVCTKIQNTIKEEGGNGSAIICCTHLVARIPGVDFVAD